MAVTRARAGKVPANRSVALARKTAATANVKLGKVIRDSFTMPAADHALIGVLKKRCIGLGVAIKKSELLRAGLTVLERLPNESLAQVVAAVESVKTGRPPGEKKKKKKRKKKRKSNRAKGKRR